MNLSHFRCSPSCVTLAMTVLFTLNATAMFVPNDPLFDDQYYLQNIEVEAAWNEGYTGKGVVIGIFDAGISAHEDIDGNLISTIGSTGDGAFGGTDGTLPAGVAAAVGGNGVGITGVAPEANLASFDVLVRSNRPFGDNAILIDEVINTDESVLFIGTGVDAETGNYQSEAGLHVRSHSHSDPDAFSANAVVQWSSLGFDDGYSFPARNNVIDVASSINYSGNGGQTTVVEHLNNTNLIVVASVTEAGTWTGFNNYGSNMFVSAPGEDILTTSGRFPRAYEEESDTSVATSIVAGVVALGKEVNPDLHVRMAKHSIAKTSELIDPTNNDIFGVWITNAAGFNYNNSFGFGEIDAGAFVQDVKDTAYVTEMTERTVSQTGLGQAVTGAPVDINISVAADANDQALEGMQITLTLADGQFIPEDAEGILIFPDGTTQSIFLNAASITSTTNTWTFTTYAVWGMDFAGDWTVRFDVPDGNAITLESVSLRAVMGEQVMERVSGVATPQTINADTAALSVQLDYTDSVMNVDGGSTFTLKDGIRLNNGDFNLVNGTVTDDGFKGLMIEVLGSDSVFDIVDANGTLNATRGMMVSEGQFTNGGQANLSSLQVQSNGTVTNSGTITMTGDVTLSSGAMTNSGTLTAVNQSVLTSGTMSNSGTLSATDQFLVSGGQFTNSGQATLNNLQVQSGGMTTNTGTVSVTQDVVAIGSTITNSNMLSVSDDFMMTTTDFTNSGTLSVTDTFAVDQGQFTNSGQATVGNLQVQSRDSFTNNGTITVNVDVVMNTADIDNTSIINVSDDVMMTASEFTNSGTVTITSDLMLQSASFFDNNNILNVNGDIMLSGSSLDNDATLNAMGNVSLLNGSTLNNTSNMTLDLNGNDLIVDNSVFNDTGAIVNGDDLIVRNGSTYNSGGVVDVFDSLDISNSALNNSELVTFNDVSISGAVQISGTTLSAVNTIVNSGEFALTTSAATFTLDTMTFSQTDSATLRLPVDPGSVTSALTVTGGVEVDGTLFLQRAPGATTTLSVGGPALTLITANTVTGNFDTFLGDPLLLEFLTDGFVGGAGFAGTTFEVSAQRDYNNLEIRQRLSSNQQAVGTMLNSTLTTATQSASTDFNTVLNAINTVGATAGIPSGDPDALSAAYQSLGQAYSSMAPSGSEAMRQLATSLGASQSSTVRRYTRRNHATGTYDREFLYAVPATNDDEYVMHSAKKDDDYYEKLAETLLTAEKDFHYDNHSKSYVFGRRESLNKPEYDYIFGRKFDVGAFIAGNYESGDVGQRGEASGFDFDQYTLTTGIDMPLGDKWVAGLTFGAGSGEADLEFNSNQVESESITVGGFASYHGALNVIDFYAGYSMINFDVQRNINFGGLNRRAQADVDAHQLDLVVSGDYNLLGGGKYSFGPTWGIHYIYQKIDGYRESGANSLDLDVGGITDESLKVQIGGNFVYSSGDDVGDFLFNLYGQFEHDLLLNENNNITARLFRVPGAATFITETEAPGETALRFGGQMGMKLSKLTSFSLAYGLAYGLGDNDLTTYSLSADVDYHF